MDIPTSDILEIAPTSATLAPLLTPKNKILPEVHISQVLGDPYGDKSAGNYLNPKAFALPHRGTLGNSGLGAIAGPGTWQFDVALSRTFQFNESQKVEFRAETFNLPTVFA